MNTDPDLLLRASSAPGILDGWCGPVVVETSLGGDWWSSVHCRTGQPGHSVLHGCHGDVAHSRIALPLDRPEAADRAARWLAGRVGLARPAGRGDGFTWSPDPDRP